MIYFALELCEVTVWPSASGFHECYFLPLADEEMCRSYAALGSTPSRSHLNCDAIGAYNFCQ